jgi:MoxR-like ATPase
MDHFLYGEAQQAQWRLKLEGIAREIDAGFAVEQLSPELAAVRKEIVTLTQQTP